MPKAGSQAAQCDPCLLIFLQSGDKINPVQKSGALQVGLPLDLQLLCSLGQCLLPF